MPKRSEKVEFTITVEMDVELLFFGVTHRLFLTYGLLENSSCILVLSLFMILPFYKTFN